MSRRITYVADLSNPFESIRLGARVPVGRRCAVLFRYDQRIATFVASIDQLKKIQKRRGRVRITEKAMASGRAWCGESNAGR